jgi:hypothetical protein
LLLFGVVRRFDGVPLDRVLQEDVQQGIGPMASAPM